MPISDQHIDSAGGGAGTDPAPGPRRPRRSPIIGAGPLGWLALWGLLTLLGAPAAADYYGDAELRAILFGCQRADTLGQPLVLLAHRTHYDHRGSGARERLEHYVWYVRDPSDPRAAALRELAYLLDHSNQAFGLKHCRIHRAGDTLDVAAGSWGLRTPPDRPAEGSDPWREAYAALPPLRAGDVLDIAFSIITHPSRTRIPSEWARFLLRSPLAPTVERHIIMTYDRGMVAVARTIRDPRRVIRHSGSAPRLELLTGNLPAGPGDIDSLQAPALLFTCAQDWGPARRVLAEHYMFEITRSQPLFAAPGDSLMRAHRNSRERIEAIFRLVDQRGTRIPRSLLASDYYARPLMIPWQGRAADDLDRTLLIAALAQAATIKVELFLGRSDPRGFDPDLITPLQFDRLLVRLFVPEEDRYIFLDGGADDLRSAEAVVTPQTVLLGLLDEWARLLRSDARGYLSDYNAPPGDN